MLSGTVGSSGVRSARGDVLGGLGVVAAQGNLYQGLVRSFGRSLGLIICAQDSRGVVPKSGEPSAH